MFLCETAFSLNACILRLASVLTQHSILPAQFPNGLSETVFIYVLTCSCWDAQSQGSIARPSWGICVHLVYLLSYRVFFLFALIQGGFFYWSKILSFNIALKNLWAIFLGHLVFVCRLACQNA